MSVLSIHCIALVLAIAGASAGEGVRFTKRALMIDCNEGCAIADVNKDGKPDIVAGRNWYAAPDFVPRPLRLIEDWKSYAQSNGDQIYDVNGDGWLDVIGGYWGLPEVHWFENPSEVELSRGRLWPKHTLGDVETKTNEAQYLRDLDGDGVPEWIINSWNKKGAMVVWKLAKDDKGQPALQKIVLNPKGGGHGIGFGDINGDGREDILTGTGWLECPAANPLGTEWKFHPDWDFHASCPMLVSDLDGDGRNDFIWGNGHDYGLFWMRQLEPKPDGTTQWEKIEIDKRWSVVHSLAWADLDGDGQQELIAGKRVRAHDDKDPGAKEPPCLYYYKWDKAAKKFARHVIDEGTVGIGMQIATGDLNGDGRIDIVVSGKAGTYLLSNQGR